MLELFLYSSFVGLMIVALRNYIGMSWRPDVIDRLVRIGLSEVRIREAILPKDLLGYWFFHRGQYLFTVSKRNGRKEKNLFVDMVMTQMQMGVHPDMSTIRFINRTQGGVSCLTRLRWSAVAFLTHISSVLIGWFALVRSIRFAPNPFSVKLPQSKTGSGVGSGASLVAGPGPWVGSNWSEPLYD